MSGCCKSSDGGDTQVIFLRYANAEDLVPILSGIEFPENRGAENKAPIPRASQSNNKVNIHADKGTNALATDSDTNILSTPSLVTLDNHEAEIVVGQNVPFVTGSYSRTGETSSTVNPFQTVERRDVGIKLRVKPQVNDGNVIRLEIEQEVSSVERGSVDETGGAGLITNTRSIKTSVLVEDGKTLVLGGLIRDDVQEGVSKVALLGDIPLFGAFFRYTTSTRIKRNLMVFLRPVILTDQAMSSRVSLNKYNLIRNKQLERDQKGVKLQKDERQPVLPEFEAFEEQ